MGFLMPLYILSSERNIRQRLLSFIWLFYIFVSATKTMLSDTTIIVSEGYSVTLG